MVRACGRTPPGHFVFCFVSSLTQVSHEWDTTPFPTAGNRPTSFSVARACARAPPGHFVFCFVSSLTRVSHEWDTTPFPTGGAGPTRFSLSKSIRVFQRNPAKRCSRCAVYQQCDKPPFSRQEQPTLSQVARSLHRKLLNNVVYEHAACTGNGPRSLQSCLRDELSGPVIIFTAAYTPCVCLCFSAFDDCVGKHEFNSRLPNASCRERSSLWTKKSWQDEVALETRSTHHVLFADISVPHGAGVVGRRPSLRLLASWCGCVGLWNCIVGFPAPNTCRCSSLFVHGGLTRAEFVWISLSVVFLWRLTYFVLSMCFRVVCPLSTQPLNDRTISNIEFHVVSPASVLWWCQPSARLRGWLSRRVASGARATSCSHSCSNRGNLCQCFPTLTFTAACARFRHPDFLRRCSRSVRPSQGVS